MISIVLPGVTAIAAFALGYFLRKLLGEKHLISRQELETVREGHAKAMTAHAAQVARLEAELSFSMEKLELAKQERQEITENMSREFRIMAATIIEDKSAQFSRRQEEHLKLILDPLKTQIDTFRKDYQVGRQKETEERISLREQIRQMVALNQTLSQQANNLTAALRGNVKQQGNWGEMILESMLEYAGLRKGYQYFVQEQGRNAEGQIIQPDIIVRYPDKRAIVIDAKVTLVHYEGYTSAPDPDAQQQSLQLLLRSLKNHIDGLSARSYGDVDGALDFVMMFVPVEAAYITALQADPRLWQYAYDRKILLISPANLIAAMKIIADMWQRDSINREAHLIADRAGKLYDKLVLFVDNFEKVGTQLQKAQDTWQDAYRQLSKGRGNMISQAEQMKLFRAKASKSLPGSMVETALDEDAASGPGTE